MIYAILIKIKTVEDKPVAALKKERLLPHYTYADYIQWDGDWEVIDDTAYAMAPLTPF